MGVLKGLDNITTESFENNRSRDTLVKLYSQLKSNPFLNGVLLEDVSLSAAQNSIAHKLGFVPSGWIVVDKTTNANIYKTQLSDNKFIYLTSTATTVVDLWVF